MKSTLLLMLTFLFFTVSYGQKTPCNVKKTEWQTAESNDDGAVLYLVETSSCVKQELCGQPRIILKHTFKRPMWFKIKLRGLDCADRLIEAEFFTGNKYLTTNEEFASQQNWHSFKSISALLRVEVSVEQITYQNITFNKERNTVETYKDGKLVEKPADKPTTPPITTPSVKNEKVVEKPVVKPAEKPTTTTPPTTTPSVKTEKVAEKPTVKPTTPPTTTPSVKTDKVVAQPTAKPAVGQPSTKPAVKVQPVQPAIIEVPYTQKMAIGLNIGLLNAPGLDFSYQFTPRLGARIGYGYMGYSINDFTYTHLSTQSDGTPQTTAMLIDAKFNMDNINLSGEYSFDKKGRFRLMAGAMIFPKKNVKIGGSLSNTLNFNELVITPEDIGSGILTLGYASKISPFVGLGIGRLIPRKRLNLSFDMAVAYMGDYSVGIDVKPGLLLERNKENAPIIERNLNAKIQNKILPTFNLRLAYKLNYTEPD
jgi:hypothetical protein